MGGHFMFSNSQINKLIVLFFIALLIIGAVSYLLSSQNNGADITSNGQLPNATPTSQNITNQTTTEPIISTPIIPKNGDVYLLKNCNGYVATIDDTELVYYKVYNPLENETVYFTRFKTAFMVVPGKA